MQQLFRVLGILSQEEQKSLADLLLCHHEMLMSDRETVQAMTLEKIDDLYARTPTWQIEFEGHVIPFTEADVTRARVMLDEPWVPAVFEFSADIDGNINHTSLAEAVEALKKVTNPDGGGSLIGIVDLATRIFAEPPATTEDI